MSFNRSNRRKKRGSWSHRRRREHFYRELKSISTEQDFDPHSTYGKFIIKKLMFDLTKYKSYKTNLNIELQSLSREETSLNELISKNKEDIRIKRWRAIDERAIAITQNDNKVLSWIHKTSWLIAVFSSFGTYIIFNSLVATVLVFLVSLYVFFFETARRLDYQKSKLLKRAEEELRDVDFDIDITRYKTECKRKIEDLKLSVLQLQNQVDKIIFDIQFKELLFLDEEKLKFILSDKFYTSTDWRKVRDKTLSIQINVCRSCGTEENLSVDHVLPRSKYPHKALDYKNTQILCIKCNSSKGNRI
jgi:hypothetical protein